MFVPRRRGSDCSVLRRRTRSPDQMYPSRTERTADIPLGPSSKRPLPFLGIVDEHALLSSVEHEDAPRTESGCPASYLVVLQMLKVAATTKSNDRDRYSFRDRADQIDVISVHRSVLINRLDDDFTGPFLFHEHGKLGGLVGSAARTVHGPDAAIGGPSPPFDVDAHDDRGRAKVRRRGRDEFRVLGSVRADDNLLRARTDDVTDVLKRPDAASRRERHVRLFSDAPHEIG